jgi:hypothetical protein
MRCAAFGPTPGSERSALASSSRPDSGSATALRRAAAGSVNFDIERVASSHYACNLRMP